MTSSSPTPSALGTTTRLAGEEVGDRAGVRQRAAVAGEREAHLGGGPVLVVREALDQHGDAVGAVALVHDRLVVDGVGALARPALDGAVDVVVRDRRLLRLLDRVEQRRVTPDVAATHAGRYLDVLDELCEELAALGVDRSLLVLGRGPFGVTGHGLTVSFVADKLACGPPSHLFTNKVHEERVDACVPGDLRVERGGEQTPVTCRDNLTGADRDRAAVRRACRDSRQDLDLRAHLLDPRRPDEHGTHGSPPGASLIPATSRSASNEST